MNSRIIDAGEWVSFNIGADQKYQYFTAAPLISCHALVFVSSDAKWGALYHANGGELNSGIMEKILLSINENKIETKNIGITIAFSSSKKEEIYRYEQDMKLIESNKNLLEEYGFNRKLINIISNKKSYGVDTLARQSETPLVFPEKRKESEDNTKGKIFKTRY
jgi:hypothetical protein